MKHFILLIALMTSVSCYAQSSDTSYTASNGITYKIGDKVHLATGKGLNGKFLFMNLGGFFYSGVTNEAMADRRYTNTDVVIKKMRYEKFNGKEIMTFIVPAGETSTNYRLSIENAIDFGEVTVGGAVVNAQFSVADELLKLKKLLDMGALTQAEFDNQKKKLLGTT